MSEDDASVGWTFQTLYRHFSRWLTEKDLRDQQRFEAQEKAVRDALAGAEKATNAALSAAQNAVQKAETAAERRFDSVNEFRGQLSDQARTFLPRLEYDRAHEALVERMAILERSRTEQDARSVGLSDGWKYLVGFAALCGPIIAVIVLLTR